MNTIDNVPFIDRVIKGGFCIGCGSCAISQPEAFGVAFDSFGQLTAFAKKGARLTDRMAASLVCPFSDSADNEDAISLRLYGESCNHNAAIGHYRQCYAGHVAEHGFRDNGSSGGFISWLLCELLETGAVDAVLHVKEHHRTQNDDRLFAYAISRSAEEIRQGSKSRYYPVTLADVFDVITREPGSFAVTGVPCFIKALRLLQHQREDLSDRIRFCIGLVCGHLKSRRFADLIGWQLGVEPGRLELIDFRHKLHDRPANQYGVHVTGFTKSGAEVDRTEAMSNIIGGDWGIGYLKYNACNYCDDVLAETADVAAGDAWLSGYVKDSQGTNVIVVRNEEIERLLEAGMKNGALAFSQVDADTVARSQEGGLRDRRSGLAYRIDKAGRAGTWTPKKRVAPQSFFMDAWFRKQQDLRSELSTKSHEAFDRAVATGRFTSFEASLQPALGRYYAHLKAPTERLRRNIKRFANRFRRLLGLTNKKSYLR